MTSRPSVLIRSTSVRHCTEPAPKTLPTTGTITVALGSSGAGSSAGGVCAPAETAARSTAAMSANRGMSFLRRRLPLRVSNKVRPKNPPQPQNDLSPPRKREPPAQHQQRIAPQPRQHGGVDAAHEDDGKARVRGELAEERLGGAEVRRGAVDLKLDEAAHAVAFALRDQLRLADAEFLQFLGRDVDAVAREIVADVARHVRQLQRRGEVAAVRDGRVGAMAED